MIIWAVEVGISWECRPGKGDTEEMEATCGDSSCTDEGFASSHEGIAGESLICRELMRGSEE